MPSTMILNTPRVSPAVTCLTVYRQLQISRMTRKANSASSMSTRAPGKNEVKGQRHQTSPIDMYRVGQISRYPEENAKPNKSNSGENGSRLMGRCWERHLEKCLLMNVWVSLDVMFRPSIDKQFVFERTQLVIGVPNKAPQVK